MAKHKVVEVELAKVQVGQNRRSAKPCRVKALADSILQIGLQHPIGITKDQRLIHGRHRLEAYALLGWQKIPAVIHDLDDLHAELAEIDENIQRHQLTALEESKALARRKEIYEALYPETKAGKAQAAGSNRKQGKHVADNVSATSFADDTAAKTGRSARSVRRDVEIGEGVTDAAAVQLHGSKAADNKSLLRELARLPEQEQVNAAKKLAAGVAKTVAEATDWQPPAEPEDYEGMDADAAPPPEKTREQRRGFAADCRSGLVAVFEEYSDITDPAADILDVIGKALRTHPQTQIDAAAALLETWAADIRQDAF